MRHRSHSRMNDLHLQKRALSSTHASRPSPPSPFARFPLLVSPRFAVVGFDQHGIADPRCFRLTSHTRVGGGMETLLLLETDDSCQCRVRACGVWIQSLWGNGPVEKWGPEEAGCCDGSAVAVSAAVPVALEAPDVAVVVAAVQAYLQERDHDALGECDQNAASPNAAQEFLHYVPSAKPRSRPPNRPRSRAS
eukprot:CCRYP_012147-RA/>CCRYP_012147-RA protein AED:0.00 eAED:0.00 QI:228/1/1/1/0/0/2/632/192